MNPPFISPPLRPSLSTISAQFGNLNDAISDSSPRYSAKDSLCGIKQSPRQALHQNESFRSASLRAFHWTKLLSSRQEDDARQTNSSLVAQQSESQTIPSSKSTAKSSLLSAQSFESLPHYALPDQEHPEVRGAPLSQSQTAPTTHENDPASTTSLQAHPIRSTESIPPRRRLCLSPPHDTPNSAPNLHRHPATRKNAAGIYHGPVSRELSGFANFGVAAAGERWRKGKQSEAESVWTWQEAEQSTFDTPSDDSGWSNNSLQDTDTKSKISVTTRCKAHLSEPRNTQNSSPVLTVNDRGQHAAGIYSEWICREGSGFANPTVAAAMERWRQSDINNNALCETDTNAGPASRREPSLSQPVNTPNSSPHLHFRGRFSGGVHSEWICRESFGFANPTDAASRQRWGVGGWREADEREGKGRWNGLLSVSSWDMRKSHVFGQTNCFDGFGNGFGMGARIGAKEPEGGGASGGSMLEALLEDVKPAASGSGCRKENIRDDDGGVIAAYIVPGSQVEASFCVPDRFAISGQATEPRPLARPDDGICNYPVPPGLIAASREAQRTRTADDTADTKATTEIDPSGPSQDRDRLPIARGNTLGLHASCRPRPRGFGESNRVPARHRREKEKYAARSFEQETHINEAHSPLRLTTKGKANGLSRSQAWNTGFGERNGAIPGDRHEQTESWAGEDGADSETHDEEAADDCESKDRGVEDMTEAFRRGDSRNEELDINNDGSPAFFRDLDYRQERNYRGSVWPQRISDLRNSGFGEGSGVPKGERTEMNHKGLAAERCQRNSAAVPLGHNEEQGIWQAGRGFPCSKYTERTDCGCRERGGNSNDGRSITAVSLEIRDQC